MIEPKTFYRKLDAVLSKIGKEKSGKNFLYSILTELQNTFSEDLYIGNGRLYKESGDGFVLVNPPGSTASKRLTKLPLESEAVQLVLKNGSYIYDDPKLSIDSEISRQNEYAIPAAFTVVHSPQRRWIVVFELKSGWVREEIEFCMNAVRTALNYRLFSDAIKSDLQQAAQIQQSLLPAAAPHVHGFQIAGRSQPAELVGGDFYDYIQFDENMLGLSVGDASGHGLPAALLVRDVVTGLRMGLEKEMKMVYTLEKLNRVIHRSTYSSRFVSIFYAEIESNGNIIYVNAGHPSPLLIHGDHIRELQASGTIIGAMPQVALHRAYAYFEPGGVLVIFSDGIFERQSPHEENFGIARLKALVVKNQNKSAQEILNLIFDTVYEFGNRTKWEDDATVVVVKRLDQ
ncbi:MAG: PP2C family protein-serine/threonine phosphatase [candidate division KSB1 bacterium]|nr:PP2C family protein-serine/threonine phosphatase [candidate division KSB1 bacterium]